MNGQPLTATAETKRSGDIDVGQLAGSARAL
jgi:hypothetical protein